jgi:hypothetical protein
MPLAIIFGSIKSQTNDWSNFTCCGVQLKTGLQLQLQIAIFSNVIVIVIANAAIIGN